MRAHFDALVAVSVKAGALRLDFGTAEHLQTQAATDHDSEVEGKQGKASQ